MSESNSYFIISSYLEFVLPNFILTEKKQTKATVNILVLIMPWFKKKRTK